MVFHIPAALHLYLEDIVVVFTLKPFVPISTQYFLTSVLVQLTRNAFRGHRLTSQKRVQILGGIIEML